MYVWVKPDTVITIREEDGQPTVNLVSLSAPTCSISRVLQFRSLDILLQRSLFCIRQPQSQSYEDLGTLDMNLEYTRATKANRDQVNICKYKIGDQLSLVHTGTIWYCILWYILEVVEQGMSKVTFLWPKPTDKPQHCPQHWLHWTRQGSNTKLSPLLWMNKTRSYTFYHVLSCSICNRRTSAAWC